MYLNFAGHGLVHLFEGVIPPLIPLLMVQFGASYFQMGLIVTVFTCMFGFGSLPAASRSRYLADRFGLSAVFIAMGFLYIASAMVGLAMCSATKHGCPSPAIADGRSPD